MFLLVYWLRSLFGAYVAMLFVFLSRLSVSCLFVGSSFYYFGYATIYLHDDIFYQSDHACLAQRSLVLVARFGQSLVFFSLHVNLGFSQNRRGVTEREGSWDKQSQKPWMEESNS